MRALVCCTAMALALSACSGTAPTGTPMRSGSPAASHPAGHSPSPMPTAQELALPEMKYALIDRLGRPWFCDPDFYPIARQDEQQLAIERFAEIQADGDAFAAILDYLGLDADTDFSDEEKLAIYREWKTLNAIVLENAAGARFHFDVLTVPPPDADQGTRTAGTVDVRGEIELEHEEPAGEPPCPICLAPGTSIATPDGPRPIESLTVGSPVWTLDAAGRRVTGTVVEIGSVRVPSSHRLVHLVLDDGRRLSASPGHPLTDGRTLGELTVGDFVDGARVTSVQRVASAATTHDVLASGETGGYWAGGIPLASTLSR